MEEGKDKQKKKDRDKIDDRTRKDVDDEDDSSITDIECESSSGEVPTPKVRKKDKIGTVVGKKQPEFDD